MLESASGFVNSFREYSENEFESGKKFLSFSSEIKPREVSFLLCRNFSDDYVYWQIPQENFEVLAVNPIFTVSGEDENFNQYLNSGLEQIKNEFVFNNPEASFSLPLFFAALKFAKDNRKVLWNDFPGFSFFLPEFIICRKEKKLMLIYNSRTDVPLEERCSSIRKFFESCRLSSERKKPLKIGYNDSSESDAKMQWDKGIYSILEKINTNELRKAVVSRKIKLILDEEPDIKAFMEKLSSGYPDCCIFAYKKEKSIFFGASPEKLACFNGNYVLSDALAGSIKRGITKEEDDGFAEELLNSTKNLAEQQAVTEYIRNAFNGLALSIEHPERPVIKKLSNIQHLWTPVTAVIKDDVSMFDVLRRIHPTPAVCGIPPSEAREIINQLESYSRGLFAGVIGWFNLNHKAEFFVGIRSALLKGKELHAFAGCGIVEGSDPDSEFVETELKLTPVLSLLEGNES